MTAVAELRAVNNLVRHSRLMNQLFSWGESGIDFE